MAFGWDFNSLYTNFLCFTVIVYTILEPLFLNNQITTLLSQLGLPDGAFFTLLSEEIKPLIFAFFDPTEAVRVITGPHKHLERILRNNPQVLNEPLVMDILKECLKEKLGKQAYCSPY